MPISFQRLLSLTPDQLSRLPHLLPDYVKTVQIQQGQMPMETLRVVRDLAIIRDDVALLEAVMTVGCDCKYVNEDNNPLHLVDDYNNGAMVEILLKAGAPITDPTRLLKAAHQGSFMRMLAWMSFVPDPTLTNEKGENAWEIYTQTREYEVLQDSVQVHQRHLVEKVFLERSLPQPTQNPKQSLRL